MAQNHSVEVFENTITATGWKDLDSAQLLTVKGSSTITMPRNARALQCDFDFGKDSQSTFTLFDFTMCTTGTIHLENMDPNDQIERIYQLIIENYIQTVMIIKSSEGCLAYDALYKKFMGLGVTVCLLHRKPDILTSFKNNA